MTVTPFPFNTSFVGWTIFVLAGFAFFQLSRNAVCKRRLWPFFIIGVSLVYGVFFSGSLLGRIDGFFLLFPILAIFSVLNIRNTRFCLGCGRTIRRRTILHPELFCPHCGEKLA